MYLILLFFMGFSISSVIPNAKTVISIVKKAFNDPTDNSKTSLEHFMMTKNSGIFHGVSLLLNRNMETKYPCIQPLSPKQKILAFVPGRNGHPNDFLPLIQNLQLKYINTTEHGDVPEYFIITIDLGETGESSLDEDCIKIKTILEQYVDIDIVLVGMSKGGFTAMRYVTTMNDCRIRKVMTISSPLQGTHVADLMPEDTITYRELRYQSDISIEIKNAAMTLNIQIYHVVPKYDHVIVPVTSARYEFTHEDNIYYSASLFNHCGITYSIEVADAVSKWLQI